MIIREYYQPEAPDPVLDADVVLALARRHLDQAHRVTGIDESGGEARVYFIDDNIVMKTQRPQQLRSWTSLAKEIVFLNQIAKDDPTLPVPRVLGYGHEESVEYTLMTRMAGDAAVRAGIPDTQKAESLRELGGVVRRIHAIDQAPLRTSGQFPEEFTPEDLKLSLVEDIEDFARRFTENQIGWPLEIHSESLLEKLLQRVPDEAWPIALHTNPGPTHTFVDPLTGAFRGLIDFGDAYIGHPVFDLWQWGEPEARDAVFQGYVTAGSALPDAFGPMWEVAQVISDFVAVIRERPYAQKSISHLQDLTRAW